METGISADGRRLLLTSSDSDMQMTRQWWLTVRKGYSS